MFTEMDVWVNNLSTRLRSMEWQIRMLQEKQAPIPNGNSDGSDIVNNTYIITGSAPIGCVVMWYKPTADIPSGWQICDGSNGTPDLRDKFVVGAGSSYTVGDTGGSDSVDISHTHGPGTLATDSYNHSHSLSGTSGSESSHTHGDGSLAASSESSHSHGLDWSTEPCAAGYDHNVIQEVWVDSTTSHTHTINGTTAAGSSHSHGAGSYVTSSDNHNHTVNAGATATGGSVAHDNRPQYYAITFIARIA